MHDSAMASMKRCIDTYLVDDRSYAVCDFGSFVNVGQVHSHRELLTDVRCTITGVDIQAGRNVDAQMTRPYTIPLASDSQDAALSGQVFEHIPFPFASIVEIARVLKPSGLFFMTVPSRGHRHSTYDLWRYYPDAMRALAEFADLELLEAHTAWPPLEGGRFSYAGIDPDEYWGDTVGVFRKPHQKPSLKRRIRRRMLTDWANEVGGLESTPIKGTGPTPAMRAADRAALVEHRLSNPQTDLPDTHTAQPTRRSMHQMPVTSTLSRLARHVKHGRNWEELVAARSQVAEFEKKAQRRKKRAAARKAAAAKEAAARKAAPPKFPDDFDQATIDIITAVRPYTMTGNDKLHALIASVRHIARTGVAGAIVECGVWRGGSMHAVAHTLIEEKQTDRELYLFDTYEGMTEPTEKDKRAIDGKPATELLEAADKTKWVWAIASLEDVTEGLQTLDYSFDQMHLVKGPVEETIPEEAPETIALLRLDTDWYESTKHELEHLYDRLVPGGVLIIDDYGSWQGSKDATDEFFANMSNPPLLVRAGRARIGIKPN